MSKTLVVMSVIALFAVLLFIAFNIVSALNPVTSTTHIGGHVCEVMQSGWSRSISCDFGK